jgi:hypothetical protein
MKLFLVLLGLFLITELGMTLGTKQAKACKDITWCKVK